MDYINEIQLKEAIIHILDQNSEEPILNEFPFILTEDIDLYLTKHLTKSLKDEELKYGYFNEGRIAVRDVTDSYFSGDVNFKDMSHEIARKLFAVMKTNGSIPSCDLIVVSFMTDIGDMIGILKLDYVKNYAHTVDFVDDKIGIKIVEQYSGLPGLSQKINKCAFVKQIKETSDLLVVDKVSKKEEKEGYSANYFAPNFLDCELKNTSRDETKQFIKSSEKWTQNAFKEDAESAEFVRTAIKQKLKDEDCIKINELAEEIFEENEEIKQSFSTYMIESGLNETVELDRTYIDKKMQRIRLKIDKDIDIYLNADAYNDDRRFIIKPNGDGSINMTIKNVMNYMEK